MNIKVKNYTFWIVSIIVSVGIAVLLVIAVSISASKKERQIIIYEGDSI